MVSKSSIACRWVFENQHKLNLVVRCCHQMRALQERIKTEPEIEIQPEPVQNYKRVQSTPKKPYVPANLSTKLFHGDRNYRFPEVQQHPQRSFTYDELEITLAGPELLRPKPDVGEIQFGKYFTDHMLQVYYHKALGGWQRPQIVPFQNLSLHPAAKVFHYAVQLFEGMKAYRGKDDRIRMFRPLLNMERMNASAVRSGLPTFDSVELARCITRLIQIDQDWVPHSEAASLYIRPTLLGIDGSLGVASSDSAILYTIICPVGSYFSGGIKPISLIADPKYSRAWKGGCGDRKVGSNYGPTIQPYTEAVKKGRHQQLWLYGDDHYVTEVGVMNLFVFYINDSGQKELLTPCLDGLILPGITRHSILQMTRSWNEFNVVEEPITMKRLVQLVNEKRVLEMFGSGTAAVVSPVELVEYLNQELWIPTMDHEKPVFKRVYDSLIDIQYGRIEHPWADLID